MDKSVNYDDGNTWVRWDKKGTQDNLEERVLESTKELKKETLG